MAVDPALTAEALVLVQAQAQTRDQIAAATTAGVTVAVRAFAADPSAWYDHAAIGRLAKSLAATTRAGQRQTATSTAAYWSRLVTLLTGRRPSTTRLVDDAKVRPVPLDVVFGRLADQYRWLQASRGVDSTPEQRLQYALEGYGRRLERLAGTLDSTDELPSDRALSKLAITGLDDLDELVARIGNPPSRAPEPLTDTEILDRVLDRAQTLADDTLTATVFAQVERSAASDSRTVTGYRRVIHPELPTAASLRDGTGPPPVCGLCVAASTRLYHRDQLRLMHSVCRCAVVPVLGGVGGDGDVGGAINDQDLQRFYVDAGGSTAAADLKRTRYRVVDHAELGPQLRAVKVAGSARTETGRKAAQSRTAPVIDPAAVLRAAEASIAGLERRKAVGEDVAGPLKFQLDLAARMRSQIAA